MTETEPRTPRDDGALLLAVVQDLVAERYTVDQAAAATLDSAFDRHLGLDSLAVAELITRVENTFDVALDREVLGTAAAPRDLLVAVQQAPRRGPRPAARTRPDTPARRDGSQRVHRIPDHTATVTEALCWHASTHPDRVHLRILDEGQAQEVSYGELRREAATVAAALLAHDLRPGDSVAIMLPTGRDYFTTFSGIMLAGGIPVPLYPPTRRAQLAAHLRRQVRILDNARARLLITDSEAALPARLLSDQVESMRQVLTPAQLTGHGEAGPIPRGTTDIAMLQYTSGSTGDPKGVMLTHANLLANIRAMGQAAKATSADVFVSWLPLYHDMGLIGAWMSSLYFGLPLAVMSPVTFLTRPSRWLWTIHDHRGTLTAAPNFAYELCLNKITDAELAGLDLSSLRMALNGAEAVNPDTLARFAERFAPHGLRRDALAPVYGLAEACVGLTFPPLGREPVVDQIAREQFLHSGRAVKAAADDPAPLRFVACGRPLPGHEIRVVDTAGNELGDRREGRIEFRGPSATTGYFHAPQATRALIRDGWLDTGDLGYLDDGELYVSGRAKDLIIRAGRNLHPEELEHAVGELPGIRQGCVAVFAAPAQTSGRTSGRTSRAAGDEAGSTERLVILAETRHIAATALAELRERIVGVTVDLLGTPPDDVVLAPPGSVLKTSSGKLRRAASRERYLRGQVGARLRPVWWQLARFAANGTRARLRRVVRAGRSGVFAAWFWLMLVAVGLPTLLGLAVLPGLGARRAVTCQALRSLARLTGIRITITGVDRLARLPGCVVVANHPSYLDGIALAAALPGRYTFVAAEVLATKPLSRFVLRRIGARFVERTDRAQSVADIRSLTQAARDGARLVFFPEAGLSAVPGLRPFRMGAFVVAADAGMPVVPITISGTRSMLWPDRDRIGLIHRGAIRIVVGEPITPTSDGWDAAVALQRAARSAIAEHCDEPDLGL